MLQKILSMNNIKKGVLVAGTCAALSFASCFLEPENNWAPEPTIYFTHVPHKYSFENLEGKAMGVDVNEYMTVTYIKVDGITWVKPYKDWPLTYIQDNGTFIVDITTGGVDETATDITSFIVDKHYKATLHFMPSLEDSLVKAMVTRHR